MQLCEKDRELRLRRSVSFVEIGCTLFVILLTCGQ